MARRAKKVRKKPETPAWLATYGDMITLVLAFFILLYSFSQIDVIKFQRLVVSIQGTLGVLDGGRTIDDTNRLLGGDQNDKVGPETRMDQENQQLEEIKNKVDKVVQEHQMQQQILQVIDERGLIIRFVDNALFDLGKADLRPEAIVMLNSITEVIRPIENAIRVEGHTDNLPISTFKFPSNWELSTSRATTVVRYLMDKGFEGNRLSAMGYGEYRPIVSNDSEKNRRLNRRIDIVVLRNEVANKQEPKLMVP